MSEKFIIVQAKGKQDLYPSPEGTMAKERICRLTALGFIWEIT